ncbi:TPA: hypothetical protein PXM30_002521 [Yersinia enterocolitica]|uniref:hypothetical protein n=1 Tax=Yersinia enterocolitica TaxID=630 RepID=UPI0021E8C9C8|nr:hypothetical protein [Yersinia enterocolitica]EKN4156682.1 hypothetical protein [Yersinia enterocolitica]UYK03206.1 hypothetical protein N4221_07200 [Yersinia enterocolitica]HDL6946318.1 hypothetical protein [Yersinia enterocolitica]
MRVHGVRGRDGRLVAYGARCWNCYFSGMKKPPGSAAVVWCFNHPTALQLYRHCNYVADIHLGPFADDSSLNTHISLVAEAVARASSQYRRGYMAVVLALYVPYQSSLISS